MCAAVLLPDDHLLGHVHQPPGKITRVGGAQGRIRGALSRASGGYEIFQHVQPLAVVGAYRYLYGLAGGVGDISAHTRQLVQVGYAASGAGVCHHIYGVIPVKPLLECRGHVPCALVPDLQYRLIALALREEALAVLLGYLVDLLLGGGHQLLLLRRYGRVTDGHGYAAYRRILIPLGLYLVQHLGRALRAVDLYAALDNGLKLLGAHQEVHLELQGPLRGGAVHIAQVLGYGPVEYHAAHGGVHKAGDLPALILHRAAHLYLCVQPDDLRVIGHHGLVHIAEDLALPGLALLLQRQVVGPQHHVLCGHRDRPAVRGLQEVVGRQHQEPGLSLCLCGQRHMHRHLVAVKVRVIGRAHQRVQL